MPTFSVAALKSKTATEQSAERVKHGGNHRAGSAPRGMAQTEVSGLEWPTLEFDTPPPCGGEEECVTLESGLLQLKPRELREVDLTKDVLVVREAESVEQHLASLGHVCEVVDLHLVGRVEDRRLESR
jgi:hypothetical protein